MMKKMKDYLRKVTAGLLLVAMSSGSVGVNTGSAATDDDNDPSTTTDIIPEAVNYVTSQVEAMGATVKKRDEHLLEVYYDTLPELEEIDKNLKMITGVIETSLFYQVATKALVAGEEGIRVIK